MIQRAGVFDRRQKFFLLLADTFLFSLSLIIVYSWRFGSWSETLISQVGLGFVLFSHLVALYIFGAYDIQPQTRFLRLALKLGICAVISSVIAIVYSYLFSLERSGVFGRGVLFGSLIVYLFLAGLLRLILVRTVRTHQKQSDWLFLVGENIKSMLTTDLKNHRLEGHVTLMSEAELVQVPKALEKKWTAVIVALDRNSFQQSPDLVDQLMQSRFKGQLVVDLVTFYESLWRKVPLFYLGADWFVLAEGFNIFRSRVGLKVKRLTDIFVSLFILVLTWPLILLAGLLIKLEDGGPWLYSQVRTGKHGVPFTIFKMRSMRIDAEKTGVQWAKEKDNRITRIGMFIRKTRIDELPQLFNVLRGEMSFIGPRPERPEIIADLEKKIPFYNLRHGVQPGLTGWAQVSFPYGASVQDSLEKLQYDLYYIRNYSLLMDVKIILHTVRVVLFGGGR